MHHFVEMDFGQVKKISLTFIQNNPNLFLEAFGDNFDHKHQKLSKEEFLNY